MVGTDGADPVGPIRPKIASRIALRCSRFPPPGRSRTGIRAGVDRFVAVSGTRIGNPTKNATKNAHPIAASFKPPSQRPLHSKGSRRTPGGTRIPNLLIRGSPSSVHGRPQPSTQPEMTGFRFRQRPWPFVQIHREWLPTWLPGESAESTAMQSLWLSRRSMSWEQYLQRPRLGRGDGFTIGNARD
jgi:hypothetical protein